MEIDRLEKFEYNNEMSWGENYNRWRMMNNDERFSYNMETYTSEQALEVFDKMYPQDENRKT